MKNQVIQMQTMNALSSREFVLNFLRALERFRFHSEMNRRPGNNVQNESLAWGAFGESMYWLYSLMEVTIKLEGIEIKDQELFNAFRYLRNNAQHQGTYPIATNIEQTVDGQLNTWVWGSTHKKSWGANGPKKDYLNRLKNREVLATLDELSTQLWGMRGWEISREAMEQPGIAIGSQLDFD